MIWFGRTQETKKAIRSQEARIAALEQQLVLLTDALRKAEERADMHRRDVDVARADTQQLADGVTRAFSTLDEVSDRLDEHGRALLGLRNDVVKLKVSVDQHATEAETQTRALFARIEAARTR